MAVLYVAALLCGAVGIRYLDASVASPLENVDGAVASVILLVYFAVTGRLGEGAGITPWNVGSIFFVAFFFIMVAHFFPIRNRISGISSKIQLIFILP